jgi:excisionase family DNA binding protein
MLSIKPSEPRPFLTPQEVSDLLRVSVYTVRRWIKDGNLPAYKVGRAWRIHENEMNKWLESRQSSVFTSGEP